MTIFQKCAIWPKYVLTGLLFGFAAAAAGESGAPDFVHGTYLRAAHLKCAAQLDRIAHGDYDFYYVVAEWAWGADDFRDETQSIAKFVTAPAFPADTVQRELVPELIRRIHATGSKILFSLASDAHCDFPVVAADPEKRRIFAAVMAEYCRKYGYDGIEVDWERTLVVPDYIALLQEMRRALNRLPGDRHYFLTSALPITLKIAPEWVAALSASLDWVNLMSYDLGGGIWGRSASHNTPLDVIARCLAENWSGLPPAKICIGLASYGFRYKDVEPGKIYPESMAAHGRYFSYTELPALLAAGWTEWYDAVHEAPYYFSPDRKEFATIDNARSLDAKMDLVLNKPYRGVFWWEFFCDFQLPGHGGRSGPHPLRKQVKDRIALHLRNL